ncbi:hypothetical protein BJV82DRAFT_584560 [Fennellomyces sp. T-0311]|nr:hypothetical protein BJV82DRAFT_584560 [Fennellomyces sp. T-0311]
MEENNKGKVTLCFIPIIVCNCNLKVSVAQATIIGNDDDDVQTMMVKMQHTFNQRCMQLEVDLQLQARKLKSAESLVGALQEKVTKLEQDNVDLQTQVNELNCKAEQTRSKKVSNGRDPVLSSEIRSYFTALRPHVCSLDASDQVIADCTMLHAAVQYMRTDFKNSSARSKLTGDKRAATNKAAQLVTARREKQANDKRRSKKQYLRYPWISEAA